MNLTFSCLIWHNFEFNFPFTPQLNTYYMSTPNFVMGANIHVREGGNTIIVSIAIYTPVMYFTP